MMPSIRTCLLSTLSLSLALFFVATALASDWPNWRGPNLDGAANDENNLPATLDQTTQKWALNLPGPSASTPVVKDGQIYLSAIDTETSNLLALCVDEKTGKVLWKQVIGPALSANKRNDFATPSAATDGKQVVFLYGNGEIVGFTTAGKELWRRNLQTEYGKFVIMWLYGSSPIMHGGRIFVQVLQNEDKGPKVDGAASYLLALDPVTGKNIWRQARPTTAPDEAGESYGTPIIYTSNGREELTLFGGDLVTAHDPATGKELWRCDGFNTEKKKNWRSIPGSTLIDGNVVSITARGGQVFAVKPGGSGDVTKTQVVWNTTELSSDVCMPLFYQGKMFILNGDKKTIRCADPKTGKVLWQGDIPSKAIIRTSPSGGDGRLYIMNENGTVYVLGTDKFEVLGTYDLGGDSIYLARSSIVLANGQVLVRTFNRLVAFGKK
jgi:outer membrane protein assembly factor BamB